MARFRGIGIGQRLTYFDGASVKALGSPWDVDNNIGWTSLSGDEDKTDEALLFSKVPWLYRGVRDRSNCVGHMPFKIELNGEEVEDDAVPFLDEPTVLFAKLETSLCLTGKAYAKLEVNSSGYIQALRYLVPTTITEHYDKLGVCDYYERTIKGVKYQIPPTEMLAIYDPDWTTENGPGKSSAARAALTSAGVLYHTDLFITRYFQRGAIKATVLTTLGFSETEAKRLQHWWDTVVAGVKNAWAAVVLKGEGVKPVVIGEGLESLQNETLTAERRQNIATALGIPESRMWSAAANYATAEQDTKNYYLSTIIPECELIAEAINAQVFTAEHNLEGYELEFQSETLDIFQAEAGEQAGALQALVTAGFPLLMAADLVGIDLTDEQRAELESMEAEPEPTPPQLQPYEGQPGQPALPAPAQAEEAVKYNDAHDEAGRFSSGGGGGGSGGGGDGDISGIVGPKPGWAGDKVAIEGDEVVRNGRFANKDKWAVERQEGEFGPFENTPSEAVSANRDLRREGQHNSDVNKRRAEVEQHLREGTISDEDARIMTHGYQHMTSAAVYAYSRSTGLRDKDAKEIVRKVPVARVTSSGSNLHDPYQFVSTLQKHNKSIEPVNPDQANALTADQVKDLDNWRQIALRKFRKQEQLPFDFVCKALDYDRAEEIKRHLIHATSEDDIIKAFTLRVNDTEPVDVTDQLKRAMDWLEAHDAVKEFVSDEQRQAFFGNLADGNISGGGESLASGGGKVIIGKDRITFDDDSSGAYDLGTTMKHGSGKIIKAGDEINFSAGRHGTFVGHTNTPKHGHVVIARSKAGIHLLRPGEVGIPITKKSLDPNQEEHT